MVKIIGFLFTLLIAMGTNATTFYPLPFTKQLVDSYGVIRAVYNGSVVKRLPSGRIMTEGSFRILQSSGLAPTDIINPDDFKVLYPGGVYQGLVYQSFGSPKFSKREEVVLILSKSQGAFHVHNLALGKYKVIKGRKETYLTSEVFPANPKIGKIKLQKFNRLVNQRFGTILNDEARDPDRLVISRAERALASVEEVEEQSSHFETFWLVLLMIGLSAISILVLNKE